MPDAKGPNGPKGPKAARDARAERLEAELRANLKRRKEQARSRARDGATSTTCGNPAGAADPSGHDPE